MLLEMEKKLIAKDFQYSTRKSHKKEKGFELMNLEMPKKFKAVVAFAGEP